MKETLFVCLDEENNRIYAATMEPFVMRKRRQSLLLHLMLQRFGPNMAATAAAIPIENT
jgi:hypothetical protein